MSVDAGDGDSCESTSECTRDLIRSDKQRFDAEVFNRQKAELNHAFAALEVTRDSLTAAELTAQYRS